MLYYLPYFPLRLYLLRLSYLLAYMRNLLSVTSKKSECAGRLRSARIHVRSFWLLQSLVALVLRERPGSTDPKVRRTPQTSARTPFRYLFVHGDAVRRPQAHVGAFLQHAR